MCLLVWLLWHHFREVLSQQEATGPCQCPRRLAGGSNKWASCQAGAVACWGVKGMDGAVARPCLESGFGRAMVCGRGWQGPMGPKIQTGQHQKCGAGTPPR